VYESVNIHHDITQGGRSIMKQMIFFQSIASLYIYITKKEMSGTLYLDDMNEESEHQNERRRKKVICTYRTEE